MLQVCFLRMPKMNNRPSRLTFEKNVGLLVADDVMVKLAAISRERSENGIRGLELRGFSTQIIERERINTAYLRMMRMKLSTTATQPVHTVMGRF